MGKRKTRRDERAVGQLVLPIGLPEEAASNQASTAEVTPSCASTGTGRPEETRPKKWYTLRDKMCKQSVLWGAWRSVQSNNGAPGVDQVTVDQFAQNAKDRIGRLRQELRAGEYVPDPVKQCLIPKPDGGQRKLGIPTVRDRIVQTAVCFKLSPIFETKFSGHSHGFRPNRGCQTALRELWEALDEGYEYIVDADISKFFDTVDHEILLAAVNEEIADGKVLYLIRQFLDCGVMQATGELLPQEEGTPQGGPLSPLLANIYLHPLDMALEDDGYRFVRYADDFVVLTRSRSEAEAALELIAQVMQTLKLTLSPTKTRLVHIDDRFDFLGFRHFRSRAGQLHRVPRNKSKKGFRQAIGAKTPRHNGQRRRKPKACTLTKLSQDQRLARIISKVNRHLRDWMAYFHQATSAGMADFKELDKFVRRRIRCSITGRYAMGHWHEILTNDLLAALGLQSLEGLYKERLAQSHPPPARA